MGAILSCMVREGLTEKLAFKQRLEGGEGGRHASISGKNVLGNRAKAPMVGKYLGGSQEQQRSHWSEASGVRVGSQKEQDPGCV